MTRPGTPCNAAPPSSRPCNPPTLETTAFRFMSSLGYLAHSKRPARCPLWPHHAAKCALVVASGFAVLLVSKEPRIRAIDLHQPDPALDWAASEGPARPPCTALSSTSAGRRPRCWSPRWTGDTRPPSPSRTSAMQAEARQLQELQESAVDLQRWSYITTVAMLIIIPLTLGIMLEAFWPCYPNYPHRYAAVITDHQVPAPPPQYECGNQFPAAAMLRAATVAAAPWQHPTATGDAGNAGHPPAQPAPFDAPPGGSDSSSYI